MTPTPGTPGTPVTPQKKKMSGCLIALLVVGGLIALSCFIGGIAVYRASQSPEGHKLFAAMGKSVELATKGMNAPGTEQLRQAGCTQAIVMNMDEMVGQFAELFDAGTRAKTDAMGTYVMCQGTASDELPDCDTLAKVYANAVHPAQGFTIAAQAQGKRKPKCQRHYAADGSGGEDVQH